MVVSGVPEATTNHAQNVADFALTMARLARSVLTPDTGKPIKVSQWSVSHPQLQNQDVNGFVGQYIHL